MESSLGSSFKRPAVAIVTLGTSDDFASHISLVDKSRKYKEQYEFMIETIAGLGRVVPIDLGYIECAEIERDESTKEITRTIDKVARR